MNRNRAGYYEHLYMVKRNGSDNMNMSGDKNIRRLKVAKNAAFLFFRTSSCRG